MANPVARQAGAPAARRLDARLLVAFMGILLFAGLLADVAADGFIATTVDPAVRDALASDGGPARVAASGVTLMGDVWTLAPLILLGVVFLVRRQRRLDAVILAAAAAASWSIVYAIKWIVGRSRPDMPLELDAFPSGHATHSLYLWGLFWFLAIAWNPRVLGRPYWRDPRPLALTAIVALPVALTRIVLDVHWFSDVAAGIALGSTFLAATLWLRDRWDRRLGQLEPTPPG